MFPLPLEFLVPLFVELLLPEDLFLSLPIVVLRYGSERKNMPGTLMLVYHCHKPVFTPKMAIFPEGGNKGGRVATPTNFLIFDFYDMKTF